MTASPSSPSHKRGVRRGVYVLPALFTLYLVYGFIRPRISGKVRREIEEDEEDEDESGSPSAH